MFGEGDDVADVGGDCTGCHEGDRDPTLLVDESLSSSRGGDVLLLLLL